MAQQGTPAQQRQVAQALGANGGQVNPPASLTSVSEVSASGNSEAAQMQSDVATAVREEQDNVPAAEDNQDMGNSGQSASSDSESADEHPGHDYPPIVLTAEEEAQAVGIRAQCDQWMADQASVRAAQTANMRAIMVGQIAAAESLTAIIADDPSRYDLAQVTHAEHHELTMKLALMENHLKEEYGIIVPNSGETLRERHDRLSTVLCGKATNFATGGSSSVAASEPASAARSAHSQEMRIGFMRETCEEKWEEFVAQQPISRSVTLLAGLGLPSYKTSRKLVRKNGILLIRSIQASLLILLWQRLMKGVLADNVSVAPNVQINNSLDPILGAWLILWSYACDAMAGGIKFAEQVFSGCFENTACEAGVHVVHAFYTTLLTLAVIATAGLMLRAAFRLCMWIINSITRGLSSVAKRIDVWWTNAFGFTASSCDTTAGSQPMKLVVIGKYIRVRDMDDGSEVDINLDDWELGEPGWAGTLSSPASKQEQAVAGSPFKVCKEFPSWLLLIYIDSVYYGVGFVPSGIGANFIFTALHVFENCTNGAKVTIRSHKAQDSFIWGQTEKRDFSSTTCIIRTPFPDVGVLPISDRMMSKLEISTVKVELYTKKLSMGVTTLGTASDCSEKHLLITSGVAEGKILKDHVFFKGSTKRGFSGTPVVTGTALIKNPRVIAIHIGCGDTREENVGFLLKPVVEWLALVLRKPESSDEYFKKFMKERFDDVKDLIYTNRYTDVETGDFYFNMGGKKLFRLSDSEFEMMLDARSFEEFESRYNAYEDEDEPIDLTGRQDRQVQDMEDRKEEREYYKGNDSFVNDSGRESAEGSGAMDAALSQPASHPALSKAAVTARNREKQLMDEIAAKDRKIREQEVKTQETAARIAELSDIATYVQIHAKSIAELQAREQAAVQQRAQNELENQRIQADAQRLRMEKIQKEKLAAVAQYEQLKRMQEAAEAEMARVLASEASAAQPQAVIVDQPRPSAPVQPAAAAASVVPASKPVDPEAFEPREQSRPLFVPTVTTQKEAAPSQVQPANREATTAAEAKIAKENAELKKQLEKITFQREKEKKRKDEWLKLTPDQKEKKKMEQKARREFETLYSSFTKGELDETTFNAKMSSLKKARVAAKPEAPAPVAIMRPLPTQEMITATAAALLASVTKNKESAVSPPPTVAPTQVATLEQLTTQLAELHAINAAMAIPAAPATLTSPVFSGQLAQNFQKGVVPAGGSPTQPLSSQ